MGNTTWTPLESEDPDTQRFMLGGPVEVEAHSLLASNGHSLLGDGKDHTFADAPSSDVTPHSESKYEVVSRAQRRQSQPSQTISVRTTMMVEGICCPSEVPLIENILNPLPGVEKVS